MGRGKREITVSKRSASGTKGTVLLLLQVSRDEESEDKAKTTEMNTFARNLLKSIPEELNECIPDEKCVIRDVGHSLLFATAELREHPDMMIRIGGVIEERM